LFSSPDSLKWIEPKTVKDAIRGKETATFTIVDYLTQKLLYIIKNAIPIISVLLAYKEISDNNLSLVNIIQITTALSILITYISEFIKKSVPPVVYVSDSGIVQQKGMKPEKYTWENINNIEFSDWNFDGEKYNLMLVYLKNKSEDKPSIIGIDLNIDLKDLKQYIESAGIMIKYVKREQHIFLQNYFYTYNDFGYGTNNNLFVFVDVCLAAVLALSAHNSYVSLTTKKTVTPYPTKEASPAAKSFDKMPKNVLLDKKGYCLVLPKGWTIDKRGTGNAYIRADISADKNSGFQVRFFKCNAGKFHTTANKYIKKYKEDMAKHWGGTIEEIERTSSKIKNDIVTARYHLKRKDGKEWYLQEVFIHNNGKVVLFQGGCMPEDKEEFSRKLDKTAKGVIFTDNKK
jgi:hypothetical protein